MHTISYQDWDESSQRVVRTLKQYSVDTDELFVRKLVNATVIQNRLLHHSSHESEDTGVHHIYAASFQPSDLDFYGADIKPALLERCDRSVFLETEFLYWNGRTFELGEGLFPTHGSQDIARLLLDHYLVKQTRTFESLYSVLDDDRNKVVLFMKEVHV
ncbi:hypothetical protein [Paenibacillus sp. CF384]|uniref:hypothetical protein n=1 Tax=Paenibacillus sp. CF384 TaxID=1884382 RepID=UPI000897A062|nr:hypothetical protein [Paenibacillus sp. CF384]SDW12818.1 hypothetical protein SAMN05518855_1001352 [Paenibacillus sp. CF384]